MPSFAVPVPQEVVNQSKTLTRFPTAVNANHGLCLESSHRIREEFNDTLNVQVNPKTIGNYPRLGLVHVVAFTIPEFLPERIPTMTRFTDFTLLNDDYYDAAEVDKVTSFNAQLQASIKDSHDGLNDKNASTIKTKQFQAGILVEMLEMDRELAMDIMTTYSDALETATFPPSGVRTLEEYLPIRLVNCGLDVF